MRQEGIPPTLFCYKLFAFNMKVNIINNYLVVKKYQYAKMKHALSTFMFN